jgi:hypothetical protein
MVVACENVLQVSQFAVLPFGHVNGPDEVEPAVDTPALPAEAPPKPAAPLAPPGDAPAPPEPLPSLEQATKQTATPASANAINEALQATRRNIDRSSRP